jgi:hypothetical protein
MNKVKKMIIACALILIFMSVQASEVNATNTALIAPTAGQAFEVLVPLSDRLTSRENFMVSFRAPRGSVVRVDVLHTDSLTNDEQFSPLYEPMKFEIGVLERGWVELKLNKGRNKIIFTATKGEQTQVISRMITVKDLEVVRQEMSRGVLQTSASDLIRRLTNTTQ